MTIIRSEKGTILYLSNFRILVAKCIKQYWQERGQLFHELLWRKSADKLYNTNTKKLENFVCLKLIPKGHYCLSEYEHIHNNKMPHGGPLQPWTEITLSHLREHGKKWMYFGQAADTSYKSLFIFRDQQWNHNLQWKTSHISNHKCSTVSIVVKPVVTMQVITTQDWKC